MLMIRSEKTRRFLRVFLPWVLIPAVILFGTLLWGRHHYIALSVLVAVASLVLFYAGLDKRRLGTRRAVLCTVMVALCVIGRLIPFFKPVTALTILCAMYLGGEAGFLTGSMAALLSNFFFGQGPWTPFQMLAWGIIGAVSGLLAKPLRRRFPLLLAWGTLTGALYSLVMDIWTVLWVDEGFSLSVYLGAMLTSLPHTALYAASNLLFLFLLAKPIGRKLSRIEEKYGL